MRGLFVTGTDTGVGKTVLSACLLASMAAAGIEVRAFKPVVTGIDEPAGEGGWPADHVALARAGGGTPAEIAPLLFGDAVSPHLAARAAGRTIDPHELVRAARARADGATLVAEGVGGLLVPLTATFSICDLAVELGMPVLVAARTGLGSINHTLLTLRVARSAGLDVRAVVLTPWPQEPDAVALSNRETIAELGEVEVVCLGEVSRPAPAELARAGATLPWRAWLAERGVRRV
jgi:dethiobiotin synthetase